MDLIRKIRECKKLRFNKKRNYYVLNFHCYKYCNCDEKIIQLFNNNSISVIENLRIIGLNHISYAEIQNKINKKIHVKKLLIKPIKKSDIFYNLDLNVLKVLFYPDEIEELSVKYDDFYKFGDIFFKNLKYLSISVYKMPHEEGLRLMFLPEIVKQCPNIEELDIERDGDDRLDFIIQNLIKFNKNLIITINYINCYIYVQENDEKYFKDNNLEKIDEGTVLYKLPNIDKEQEIYVTLNTFS